MIDKKEVRTIKAVENMMLREIAGEYILIPGGEAAKKLYGIISLSESGKMLWQMLEKECSEEELVDALLATYDVSKEIAQADVKKFLDKLKKQNLLI